MKKRLSAIVCLMAANAAIGFAQGITFHTDASTGAISQLAIPNDAHQMNWVLSPDGQQYKWVTSKYGWGLGFLTVDGKQMEWKNPVGRKEFSGSKDKTGKRTSSCRLAYRAGNIAIAVTRTLQNGELYEKYAFKNVGKAPARITDWGIYTPWNDNYPDAPTCMTNRCNVHVWAGDNAAYACAVRMGDKGVMPAKGRKDSPVVVGGGNVGLMLLKGSLPDYEVWERKKENANSNFRGVFAMNLPDMSLDPGKSYAVAWKVFGHNGKEDFFKKLLAAGGAIAKSDKYVYQQGEEVKVYLEKDRLKSLSATVTRVDMKNGNVGGGNGMQGGSRPEAVRTGKDARGHYACFTAGEPGERRIDLVYNKEGKTHATILVTGSYERLIGSRVRFILDHQQMNDTADPRNGAYMVYDNDTHSIYKNDDGRKSYDCDEGRERVGMGVMLAKWYLRHPDERLKQSLVRYARFFREKLQRDDYTTYSRVTKDGWNRGYNYAWAADFFFHMYEVTKDRQYAIDGYQTMQALYRHTGYGFYCIDIPVTLSLKVLKEAGMQTEYNDLLIDYSRTADTFMSNGLNFPKSEVNFEQSIVAPAAQFLLELYLQTRDSLYLNAAKRMMPVVENLCGSQPDYRLNEIPIRHWDCYWFGKRQVFGDTFPHYWSCINANVYYYYALASGRQDYMERAKEIVRNNLCNVFEDGSASCAFVYPRRVNGERARFADAFANDQDWALAFYLMINS